MRIFRVCNSPLEAYEVSMQQGKIN
jgi:hypothetical protein